MLTTSLRRPRAHTQPVVATAPVPRPRSVQPWIPARRRRRRRGDALGRGCAGGGRPSRHERPPRRRHDGCEGEMVDARHSGCPGKMTAGVAHSTGLSMCQIRPTRLGRLCPGARGNPAARTFAANTAKPWSRLRGDLCAARDVATRGDLADAFKARYKRGDVPPRVARIAAKEHVWRAICAVGGLASAGGACLWHVIGLEQSLKEWALVGPHGCPGDRFRDFDQRTRCARSALRRETRRFSELMGSPPSAVTRRRAHQLVLI
jgi:hypothetical protein